MRRKNTLKQTIYTKLLNSILKNEFKVNQVLSEKALVEMYNVSKSPVREALIELCNEGILRSIPRYGYEILKLTNSDIQEIQKYRLILEGECLKTYWDMITPANIKSLRDLYESTDKNKSNFDILTHWAMNSDFHLLLISFFGNKYIYDNLKTSLFTLARARAQLCFDKWNNLSCPDKAECHCKIINALESNNKDDAIKYLIEDIKTF